MLIYSFHWFLISQKLIKTKLKEKNSEYCQFECEQFKKIWDASCGSPSSAVFFTEKE